MSLKEKLKKISYAFIDGSEVSCQEAVYSLLSMELSRSSRACVYINTAPPEDRVQLVKARHDLEEMATSSTNVFVKNLLDHYADRDKKKFGNTCLADFASLYVKKAKKEIIDDCNEDSDDFNNSTDDDDVNNDNNKNQDEDLLLLKETGYRSLKNPRIIRYRRYRIENDELNFYREQLMLFVPWFDEKKELIDVDVKQKYRDSENIIKEKRALYNKTLTDFDEIERAIRILEEADARDINTNNRNRPISEFEKEMDREFQQQDSDDDNELLIEKGLEITTNKSKINNKHKAPENCPNTNYVEFRLKNLMENIDYYALMRSLNEKQQKYLLHALHLFKTAQLPIYQFVCGGAGVGKSRLITALNETLCRYYNTIPNDQQVPSMLSNDKQAVLLGAFTGRAASNISGFTLHSIFDLPTKPYIKLSLSHEKMESLSKELSELKLIIIDEISMVGYSLFSKIDKRLRQLFDPNKAFGGISVIVFGDFRQLRPVKEKYIFDFTSENDNQPYNNQNPIGKYIIDESDTLWRKFQFTELTEIMRQKDDLCFAKALNNLPFGEMDSEDIKLFQERHYKNPDLIPKDAVRLYFLNEDVNAYNQHIIDTTEGEEDISVAVDIAYGNNCEQSEIEKALKDAKKAKISDCFSLPYKVTFKCGVRYMVTVNIDRKDVLLNGIIGTLRHITKATQTNKKILWMEFPKTNNTEEIGGIARAKIRDFAIEKQINLNWTPITQITREFLLKGHPLVTISRTQFPLVAAEAITIHKAQGSTYSKVAVNLSAKLDAQLLYVACSRATSARGLYLFGAPFTPPKVDKSKSTVYKELKRLRTEAALQYSLTYLQDVDETKYMKVIFHNVRSFNAHKKDVEMDRSFMSADLIMIVESWSVANDDLDLDSYHLFAYNLNENSENRRKPSGYLCYVKQSLKNDFIFIYDDQVYGDLFIIRYKSCYFCGAYRDHHRSNITTYVDYLNKKINEYCNSAKHLYVFGDFNFNILPTEVQNTKQIIDTKFHELKLVSPFARSTVTYTTNYQTFIDWCYIKLEDRDKELCQAGVYESYFSDHKPIWLIIDKSIFLETP